MAKRARQSLAKRIVQLVGGRYHVASVLHMREDAVRAWDRHGIPAMYHHDIMQLAKAAKQDKFVTIERLRETSNEGRALRAVIRAKAALRKPKPISKAKRGGECPA